VEAARDTAMTAVRSSKTFARTRRGKHLSITPLISAPGGTGLGKSDRGQAFGHPAKPKLEGRIVDAHPRRFADPQDDSNFHPRTWQRAARLGQVSFHRLQRGLRGWS